jgi:hypothetical protein
MARHSGFLVHTLAGQKTATFRLFVCPGGMLMGSFFSWPVLTASRCSKMASRCQFQTSGVPGSTICQAPWRTN